MSTEEKYLDASKLYKLFPFCMYVAIASYL